MCIITILICIVHAYDCPQSHIIVIKPSIASKALSSLLNQELPVKR